MLLVVVSCVWLRLWWYRLSLGTLRCGLLLWRSVNSRPYSNSCRSLCSGRLLEFSSLLLDPGNWPWQVTSVVVVEALFVHLGLKSSKSCPDWACYKPSDTFDEPEAYMCSSDGLLVLVFVLVYSWATRFFVLAEVFRVWEVGLACLSLTVPSQLGFRGL